MQSLKRCLTPTRAVPAFLWLIFSLSLQAQEKQPEQKAPQGNALTRIFYGDYVSPSTRTLQMTGEGLLDAMISDGRIELTVDDAVRLALENNLDINVLRYNPYFTLWGIDAGKAVLNPSVQFNTNLNRNVTPTTSALQGSATLLSLANLYNVNVHKPFEPGLDFDFTYSTNRARSNSTFNNLNPSLTTFWSLSLTQHLLKGFGGISRGRFLRIARNNYDISVENFTSGVIGIVTNVLNTYWTLVYNLESIQVKETSLKLAQTVLDQTRIQEQVGTMARLDVLQAEAEVASRQQQVVTARHAKKIIEDQLKKLISSRPDPGLVAAEVIPTSKAEVPPPPPSSVSEAIGRALETRPELKQQMLAQRNNRIQVDYTRNQLKPTLDFTASYSMNGLGGDTIIRDYSGGIFGAPIIGIEPGGFLDSLNSLFSGKYLGYTLGFTLRVPIGNDQARADNAQAQITYKQGEEQLRALRQQVTLEVRQAYNTIEMSRASVDAARVTVRYQEERLQAEQDKYMLGASTTRFVLEAQNDLQNAQSILLQAQTALIMSYVALDKAVGDTLRVHNIEVQDALRR